MCGPPSPCAPFPCVPCVGVESVMECLMVVDPMDSGDVFSSASVPEIGLAEYVRWWDSQIKCSKECYAWAVVLIARSKLVVCSSTVHRILLAALVMAVKYRDDMYFSNRAYAAVGGVCLQELNRLEVAFATACGWNLHVSNEEFANMQATIDERDREVPPMAQPACLFSLQISRKPNTSVGLILKGTRVAGVVPRSSSQLAGVARNMTVLSVNSIPVFTDSEITTLIKKSGEANLVLTVAYPVARW